MAKKIQKKKEKNQNRNLIIASVIVLLVLASSFAIGFYVPHKTATGNIVQKTAPDYPQGYDENACRCLERNRAKCNNGFEVKGSFCVNETLKTYTSQLKACSKYECSGTVYMFNQNKQIW